MRRSDANRASCPSSCLHPCSPVHNRSVRLRQVTSAETRRAAATEDLARAGVRDAEVQIVAYDPAWPAAFEVERKRLTPLLGGAEVHHFGSTSVPGLAAKPVIDMIALVSDLDAPVASLVADMGYQFPQAFNATLTHRRFLCYPSVEKLLGNQSE